MARTRKGLVAVLAMLTASGIALTGCSAAGTPDSSEPTKLNVWGWVPGFEDLVDEWNEKNPDIEVDFHRMTGDDGEKVKAAVDAGAGPDVVQLSTHDLPEYVIADRVQDISEFTGDIEERFTESSWASVSFGDAVYGIPQGIGPAGMMYREDIFAKYDIAIPTTWDEYLEAARAIRAADPNVYIAGFSPSEIGQWMQEVWQAEGSWFGIDGDTWTVSVNSDENKLVAERWQQLLDEDLVAVTQMWTPEYWAQVNAGTLATVSYAAWFPVQLAENAADTSGLWKVAPLPTNAGESFAGESGGAANVVLKGAKNPEAAAEFAAWINSADETQDRLISVGGLFPSTLTGLDSPELTSEQEFFGGQVINEVFIEAAKNTPNTWVDGPAFSTASAGITDGFAKVAVGEKTFVQVLDEVQEATIAALKDKGLNVKAGS